MSDYMSFAILFWDILIFCVASNVTICIKRLIETSILKYGISIKVNCLICYGVITSLEDHTAKNIFEEKTLEEESYAKLLSELLEAPLSEDQVYSKYLCKKCFKMSYEYACLQRRMNSIKADLTVQFKATKLLAQRQQLQLNGVTQPTVMLKKLVLPASKLQPLPSDFVLNVERLPSMPNSFSKVTVSPQNIVPKANINLRVTVGSTVLTQSVKTSIPKTQIPTSTNILLNEYGLNNISSSMLMSNAKQKLNSDENNDELPMEIDEECSLFQVKKKDINIVDNCIKEEESSHPNVQYLDVISEDGTTEKIELRMLNDDDDENEDNDDQETIVMSSDSNSILRVMGGQRLIYENGKLSLAPHEDDGEEDQDQNDGNGEDQDDNDDSNDDNQSQIELQMSGDEETANAIIAAAQEQGGAFIEVESGEMFRVEAVKSNTKHYPDNFNHSEYDSNNSIVMKDGEEFKCLVCEKNGKDTKNDVDAIMSHMKTEHDARIYICKVCHKIFRRKADHIKHTEEHTTSKNDTEKSKLHKCTVCYKTYSARTLLTEHMNMHTGTRPYTCKLCNKSFATKYTHQSHMKTHTERPRPYKCDHCSKCFLTQQNLTQHLKTHCDVKDFVCNFCGKAFASQHNLDVHGITHSGARPFACGVCPKAFARRAELSDHARTHTGERPFACEVCGASFAQRSNLHSHRRAIHMNDKRHRCEQCPKKFKRRRLLEYHIKAAHTGERPLACKFCDSRFVYHEHYKKHIRMHTGERPYICEVCGKSFNSRDNRNTHRFQHSDKKPYECVVCGAGYMRKQLLYAHMNQLGHLAESIVVNQPRIQNVVEDAEGKPSQEVKTDKLEALLTSQGLELDSIDPTQIVSSISLEDHSPRIIITNDKSFLLQDTSNLNVDPDTKDCNLLQGIPIEALGDQTQLMTTDDNGDMVRLMQVKLDNGVVGWVAINNADDRLVLN